MEIEEYIKKVNVDSIDDLSIEQIQSTMKSTMGIQETYVLFTALDCFAKEKTSQLSRQRKYLENH